MLTNTYASINDTNLIDCKNSNFISCAQCSPTPLYKQNFLGEFKTELDKARVRNNLGISIDTLELNWKDVNK